MAECLLYLWREVGEKQCTLRTLDGVNTIQKKAYHRQHEHGVRAVCCWGCRHDTPPGGECVSGGGGAAGMYQKGGGIRLFKSWTPVRFRGSEGGRGLKAGGEGGGVGWLGAPSSQGPPMVPAEGGPEILKLKSSWHRGKILAVSLKHWKGGLGVWGGGGYSPSP